MNTLLKLFFLKSSRKFTNHMIGLDKNPGVFLPTMVFISSICLLLPVLVFLFSTGVVVVLAVDFVLVAAWATFNCDTNMKRKNIGKNIKPNFLCIFILYAFIFFELVLFLKQIFLYLFCIAYPQTLLLGLHYTPCTRLLLDCCLLR